MGFTINQLRHFYVATSVKEPITDKPRAHLGDVEAVGTLQPQINKDKDHLYFEYVSPAGVVRSDMIRLSKISYVKITPKEELRLALKSYEIAIQSANPLIKDEHVVIVKFKQFLAPSEEDTQSLVVSYKPKKAGESVSDILKNLAFQLGKSVIKSFTGMVQINLDGTIITEKTTLAGLTGNYTKITIEELPQPWSLGLIKTKGVDFQVTVLNDEEAESTIEAKKLKEDRTTKFVPNGTIIADMEHFYHGFRGDIYRLNGYPNVILTSYVADPSKEYYTLDIHYAHSDEGISTYHSEKDITIASEDKEDLVKIAQAIKSEASAKNVGIEVYSDEC